MRLICWKICLDVKHLTLWLNKFPRHAFTNSTMAKLGFCCTAAQELFSFIKNVQRCEKKLFSAFLVETNKVGCFAAVWYYMQCVLLALKIGCSQWLKCIYDRIINAKIEFENTIWALMNVLTKELLHDFSKLFVFTIQGGP